MPKKNPQMSYTLLRNYMERFSWTDPQTGIRRTGFNPPEGAADVARQEFFIRYITEYGKVEEGNAICLKAFAGSRQHLVKFTSSGEIRRIRDYLVIEIDGTRFFTH